MIRVLIIYDVPLWAYHRRALALQKYAPADVQVDICLAADIDNGYFERIVLREWDVVFHLDYMNVVGLWNRLRRNGAKIPIVVSFNKDRNSRGEFWETVCASASVVIVNNMDRWLCDRRENAVCIANGVDMDYFHPATPIADRPLLALWTGSSNPSKGKRYPEVLRPLENDLPPAFSTDFRPINHVAVDSVYSSERMVRWYNSGSFILCASRTEGTPNTTLEGIACGCVPVSTWVANIQEFGKDRINCVICEPTVEGFKAGLIYAANHREELAANARESLMKGGWHWAIRAQYFYAIFRRLACGGKVKSFTYLDTAPVDI